MKKLTKTHLILLIILLMLVIWTLWGNTALQVSGYVISSDEIPEAFSGFRILQISDFHNADYWEEDGDLIRKIAQAEPDIIVITGDMIDSRHTDMDLALRYAAQMVKVAPTYYVTGNHEGSISDYETFKAGLTDKGVTVMEDKLITIEREGAQIDILGIDDPAFLIPRYFAQKEQATAEAINRHIGAPERFTVLLAHRPELFHVYAECGADLIFSGHAHGGQARFPFIGGLIAPDQGFFPEYDAGRHELNGSTMIISRGVGNSIIPIRFNNRPEIPVVILQAK